MLNEFYKYIANNTIGFFQSHQSAIRPGERYCLRLDTEEMVASVDQALRQKTLVDGIQGNYQYVHVLLGKHADTGNVVRNQTAHAGDSAVLTSMYSAMRRS